MSTSLSIKLRQAVERFIVESLVDELLEQGFVLNVDNGGDTDELPHHSSDKSTILKAMFATDDEYLVVKHPTDMKRRRIVHLVYGNDGHDVISDYASSLEPHIIKTSALAEQLGDGQLDISITIKPATTTTTT